MKLAICVMHAAFEPKRHDTLAKLLERIGYDDSVIGLPKPDEFTIERDETRRGAWPVARACWEWGISSCADWIIVMNDDALPCEDFVERAREALSQRKAGDPVCFYTAHPRAAEALPARWYTTLDDLVGVGCALSREAAREFLSWADENAEGLEGFSDDGRINLWAMATGRRIYTTVPSLVDHQLPDESTVTWSSADARTAIVPPETPTPTDGLCRAPLHFGRRRSGNHWELLHRVDPTPKLIERAYEAHRNGAHIGKKPHVFIAMPAARAPELAVRKSVERIQADLIAHGIDSTFFESPGDSLVTRGRHVLCHEFLCSVGTHFLQWDDDIEVLDPSTVRKMLESGHDIVGCAYPWRDGSGRVVCNPLPETVAAQHVDFDPHHCMRVAEVGTGFLMVTRRCLVDLMARHHELLYEADIEPYVGAPMWALFDAHLEMRASGRRRYASEDWRFCSLAREAGYGVHVYYPPVLRHWGKRAHEGHITKAWGMGPTQAREAAQ